MVRIYNQNGIYKEYDESEVEVITITADNIERIENFGTGVNIHFKNGTTTFIDNAKTDGFEISFNLQ